MHSEKLTFFFVIIDCDEREREMYSHSDIGTLNSPHTVVAPFSLQAKVSDVQITRD